MTPIYNNIRHRRGNVLLYIMGAMVAFTGFLSLAVDTAHIRLVHNELQFAADAGARYGAAGLATSVTTAQNNAVFAAGEVNADGSQVVISGTNDVTFGTWSGGTFTVLTGAAQSTANAVKVTCHRTSAAGNPVKLIFAAILGIYSADVTVSSIATYTSSTASGIVGINSLTMSGNASTNSYNSSTSGPYSAGSANQSGNVLSNGNISLSGSATVFGNATPGQSHSATGGIVTGSRASQTSTSSFPTVTVGNAATTNNNSAVAADMQGNDFNVSGSNSATMPSGTYYFHNFTMSGSSVLTITGPVKIYVTGSLNISGSVSTDQSVPSNLQFLVASSANVALSGGTTFYGEVYAPQSSIALSGQNDFCGSVVGASLDISGQVGVHYDQSIGGGTTAISLVQ